jgi:hypothetical protein
MWRCLKTDPPTGDDCVVLFPCISDVGIMYVASNPEYARENAVKHGYTHWMSILRHQDHDAAKAACDALSDRVETV